MPEIQTPPSFENTPSSENRGNAGMDRRTFCTAVLLALTPQEEEQDVFRTREEWLNQPLVQEALQNLEKVRNDLEGKSESRRRVSARNITDAIQSIFLLQYPPHPEFTKLWDNSVNMRAVSTNTVRNMHLEARYRVPPGKIPASMFLEHIHEESGLDFTMNGGAEKILTGSTLRIPRHKNETWEVFVGLLNNMNLSIREIPKESGTIPTIEIHMPTKKSTHTVVRKRKNAWERGAFLIVIEQSEEKHEIPLEKHWTTPQKENAKKTR